MGFSFADIILKSEGLSDYFQIQRHQVFVVKVNTLYEKTKQKIKLFNENTDKNKSRPIIILEVKDKSVKAFATSTKPSPLVFTKKSRKKVNFSNCKLNTEDCHRIKFSEEAYVFILKNGDYRIFLNVEILKELLNEGQAKYCGKCEEELLKSVENFYI
ncbi:hypothetical protein [Sulfurihydrogenibium sp.]|uniref:hypothetical protein n=1 Tax=Sulfurihydrogenibium sp. TaxID=2053621 RepID=UPI00260C0995|nr:hypothetical protein [Sulfurihydrogenibium sp.]